MEIKRITKWKNSFILKIKFYPVSDAIIKLKENREIISMWRKGL